MFADLARDIGMMLGNVPSQKEMQRVAIQAKEGVRNRRGNHLQVQLASQTLVKPLTQSILLDSINWTMSEPSSTVSVCMDSFSLDDVGESTEEPYACFVNFLRPLFEREKSELVFKNHFITLMFPRTGSVRWVRVPELTSVILGLTIRSC